MRIAVVSTPFVPVPPIGYGGTERVVDELVTGLIAAGEDVTLFTCGRPPAKRHARLVVRVLYQRPVWPPTPHAELTHATWALEEVSRGNFDLVHVHVPAAAGLASKLQVPLLCTVHHAQLDAYDTLYARAQVSLVAISASQRRLSPAIARATVIHHGLSPHAHPFGSGQGGYAAFLGRLSSEKGVHLAIDIADRAGVPLKIAGRPHWEDQDYYARLVEPRLYRARSRSRAVGELDGKRKVGLLAGAMALLFPIQWDEPFGLVMIEAMLSGTPVIALARGAVPK